MKYVTIFLFLLTRFNIGFAQISRPVNFQVSIGVGAGLILPNNQKIQDGLYQISLHLNAEKIKEGYTITSGIGVSKQIINKYNNEVTYTSKWVNGLELTRVKLQTNINQFFLVIPFYLGHQLNKKIKLDAGIDIYYLLSSAISQEALGNYSVASYPNDGEYFTEVVKSVHKIDNEKNTASFRRYNITPVGCISYGINEHFKLKASMGYELYSNPVVDTRFNAYTLIRSSIFFTYQF